MEFLVDNWFWLLLATIFVLGLNWLLGLRRDTSPEQAASDMAETQKLIIFLETCSDDEALRRWADVQRYVYTLGPGEHSELMWGLAHVDRGDGVASRLVAWVRQESELLLNTA